MCVPTAPSSTATSTAPPAKARHTASVLGRDTVMLTLQLGDAFNHAFGVTEMAAGTAGGGVWEASVRGIYRLPAKLELNDVLSAVALSLVLSWGITLFPARRAARMNPVEALRYE